MVPGGGGVNRNDQKQEMTGRCHSGNRRGVFWPLPPAPWPWPTTCCWPSHAMADPGERELRLWQKWPETPSSCYCCHRVCCCLSKGSRSLSCNSGYISHTHTHPACGPWHLCSPVKCQAYPR